MTSPEFSGASNCENTSPGYEQVSRNADLECQKLAETAMSRYLKLHVKQYMYQPPPRTESANFETSRITDSERKGLYGAEILQATRAESAQEMEWMKRPADLEKRLDWKQGLDGSKMSTGLPPNTAPNTIFSNSGNQPRIASQLTDAAQVAELVEEAFFNMRYFWEMHGGSWYERYTAVMELATNGALERAVIEKFKPCNRRLIGTHGLSEEEVWKLVAEITIIDGENADGYFVEAKELRDLDLTNIVIVSCTAFNCIITKCNVEACSLDNCIVVDTRLYDTNLTWCTPVNCIRTKPSSGFHIFPSEVRRIIFGYCVQPHEAIWVVSDSKPTTPPLIVALRGKTFLYQEVLKEFYKYNYFLDSKGTPCDLSAKLLATLQNLDVRLSEREDTVFYPDFKGQPELYFQEPPEYLEKSNIRRLRFENWCYSSWNPPVACIEPTIIRYLQTFKEVIRVEIWFSESYDLKRATHETPRKKPAFLEVIKDIDKYLGCEGRPSDWKYNSKPFKTPVLWYWQAPKGEVLRWSQSGPKVYSDHNYPTIDYYPSDQSEASEGSFEFTDEE